MEYLIATIVIMLFCITALLQEKSSESAIITWDKPKASKPGKIPVIKHITRHTDSPVFVSFIGSTTFTGMLCYDVIPINGGRVIGLYPPARYSVAEALQLTRQNYDQLLPGVRGNSIKKTSMLLYYCYLVLLNLFSKD